MAAALLLSAPPHEGRVAGDDRGQWIGGIIDGPPSFTVGRAERPGRAASRHGAHARPGI